MSGSGAYDKVQALAGVTNAGNITGTVAITTAANLAGDGFNNMDGNDILAISVSGTPSVADINTIAGRTAGVLTATLVDGTAATADGLTTLSTDVITHTT